jgi:cytoskeletal protein CcmA (bactofilin family)
MRNRFPRGSALATLALGVTLIGWPVAARAAPPSPSPVPGIEGSTGAFEDQVVLSGSVDVPRGTAIGEVVVFHGRANVEGVVHGDVVVLSGPIRVSGQVSGSVIALDGPITLGPSAQVGRDVLGGNTVSLAPGAYVGGRLAQHAAFTLSPEVAALGVLLASLMMAASLLIVGLVLLALAPRGAERVAEAARGAGRSSAAWGVGVVLGLPVLAVVAIVTVVGLPLGLTLLLSLAFLLLVGFALSAWSVGRAIVPPPRTRWGAFGVGWCVASLLGLVPVLNVIVWVAGSVFGLGAMIVAIWRVRREPPIVVPPAAPSVPAEEPGVPAEAPPMPATPPGG